MGNSKPKAGSGRSTAAVPLSNRMMAIEPVFFCANEIPPSHASQSMFSASKNAMSDALRLSAAPESRESRELRPICHVTTSCDYRERFISAKVIAKPIETTNEKLVQKLIRYVRAWERSRVPSRNVRQTLIFIGGTLNINKIKKINL
jgi:hypothetical protein